MDKTKIKIMIHLASGKVIELSEEEYSDLKSRFSEPNYVPYPYPIYPSWPNSPYPGSPFWY